MSYTAQLLESLRKDASFVATPYRPRQAYEGGSQTPAVRHVPIPTIYNTPGLPSAFLGSPSKDAAQSDASDVFSASAGMLPPDLEECHILLKFQRAQLSQLRARNATLEQQLSQFREQQHSSSTLAESSSSISLSTASAALSEARKQMQQNAEAVANAAAEVERLRGQLSGHEHEIAVLKDEKLRLSQQLLDSGRRVEETRQAADRDKAELAFRLGKQAATAALVSVVTGSSAPQSPTHTAPAAATVMPAQPTLLSSSAASADTGPTRTVSIGSARSGGEDAAVEALEEVTREAVAASQGASSFTAVSPRGSTAPTSPAQGLPSPPHSTSALLARHEQLRQQELLLLALKQQQSSNRMLAMAQQRQMAADFGLANVIGYGPNGAGGNGMGMGVTMGTMPSAGTMQAMAQLQAVQQQQQQHQQQQQQNLAYALASSQRPGQSLGDMNYGMAGLPQSGGGGGAQARYMGAGVSAAGAGGMTRLGVGVGQLGSTAHMAMQQQQQQMQLQQMQQLQQQQQALQQQAMQQQSGQSLGSGPGGGAGSPRQQMGSRPAGPGQFPHQQAQTPAQQSAAAQSNDPAVVLAGPHGRSPSDLGVTIGEGGRVSIGAWHQLPADSASVVQVQLDSPPPGGWSLYQCPSAGNKWPDDVPFFAALLEPGIPFLKHGRTGYPHKRLLWMDVSDPADPSLVWHEGVVPDPSRVKEKDKLRLIDILDIKAGRVSAVLLRSGNDFSSSKYMTFTADSRSLDAEFATPEMRDFCFKKFADLFSAYATAQIEKLRGEAITLRVLAIMDNGQDPKPRPSAEQAAKAAVAAQMQPAHQRAAGMAGQGPAARLGMGTMPTGMPGGMYPANRGMMPHAQGQGMGGPRWANGAAAYVSQVPGTPMGAAGGTRSY